VILITVANALTDSYAGIVFEAPGNVSFNVFNSVWTILVGAFLLIVPLRFAGSKVNHHFGALALDALTAIFWFAGFIALAVWTNRWHNAGGFIVTGRIYNSARHYRTPSSTAICINQQQVLILTSLCRLLFTATTVLSGLHSNRSRGSITKSNTAATPAATV
jgi:hypothetical protein